MYSCKSELSIDHNNYSPCCMHLQLVLVLVLQGSPYNLCRHGHIRVLSSSMTFANSSKRIPGTRVTIHGLRYGCKQGQKYKFPIKFMFSWYNILSEFSNMLYINTLGCRIWGVLIWAGRQLEQAHQ